MVKIPSKYLRLVKKGDLEKCLELRESRDLIGKFISEEYELSGEMLMRLGKFIWADDLCRHQRMSRAMYEGLLKTTNSETMKNYLGAYDFLQLYVKEGRERW